MTVDDVNGLIAYDVVANNAIKGNYYMSIAFFVITFLILICSGISLKVKP